MIVENVIVKGDPLTVTDEVARTAIKEFRERFPDLELKSVVIKPTPDNGADVTFTAHAVPFERIRRITGYLTGDLTSWNNAKRAEESERVKHG